MIFLKDVREFSVEAAEFIALAVARGESIRDLHENCEELVPSPLVVNRWRKQYPAFDAVMREAEEAKAQTLADEVIKIADDEDRQAAQAGNAIKARQWLAGKLAEKWGTAPVAQPAAVNITNMVQLTDDQLKAIAGSAIDGEYALVGKDVVADSVGEEKGDLAAVVCDGEGAEGDSDAKEVRLEPGDSLGGSIDGSDGKPNGWGFLNEENA